MKLTKPTKRAKRGRALCIATTALALPALFACANEPTGPAGTPPPQIGSDDFEDPMDLLESIREGAFVRRAGLQEEIQETKLPAPVIIEFVSGTEVPVDQQDELRVLASQIAGRKPLLVDLVGCSDPSGSEQLNLRISQSRAEAVAGRLLELGVAESQLGRVVGRGEDCPEQERMVRIEPRLAEDAA